MYEFRWNSRNIDHIGEHGLDPGHAEFVVNHPARGFPRREADHKFRAWGQTMDGQYLQVVYIFDPPGVVYVIHARRLTQNEKRRAQRRRN
jgi:uncharacterized DUF497 family protein